MNGLSPIIFVKSNFMNKLHYDEQLAKQAVKWIEVLTNETGPSDFDSKAVHLWLRSGIVLCILMNHLSPGSVKRINEWI